MAHNLILFCEKVLPLFSRKSTKRYLELDFCDVKNALKCDENYAFWRAPRTIHIPRSGFQIGAQNRAKWRQNTSKIIAKWARKNIHPGLAMVKSRAVDRRAKMHTNAFIFVVPGVALLTPWMQKSLKIVENSPKNNHKKYEARSCNGQQYTPSADLRKCIKTRSFYRSRCCFAHATDWKNRSKSSKIIDGGMHSVYGRARREAGQFEVYYYYYYYLFFIGRRK